MQGRPCSRAISCARMCFFTYKRKVTHLRSSDIHATNCQRIVRAALHGRIIHDDDAFTAGDPSYAGDDSSSGDRFRVHLMRSQLRELKERRVWVQQKRQPAQRHAIERSRRGTRRRQTDLSLGSFFPALRMRSTALDPPPCLTSAILASRSATSASMASALAANSGDEVETREGKTYGW